MIICIYHSRDLDGWCSAAIVRKSFEEQHPESPVYNSLYSGDRSIISSKKNEHSLTLLGWDYGDEIPNLSWYNKVIMCDISFPKEEMEKIAEEKDFVWIDHHASAIKEMDSSEEFNSNVEQRFTQTNYAACELTWFHFYPNEKISEFVRLLGRYDCFGHKGTDEEEKVLLFQYSARANINGYEECYKWLKRSINESYLEERMISSGEDIYKYLCTEAQQDYKDRFDIELWEKYTEEPVKKIKRKFACVNKKRFNPVNFGIDYHKDGYDGFACFHYANGMYNFSLYNDNGQVDCSVIVKSFGGGGHKGASGFRIDDLKKLGI